MRNPVFSDDLILLTLTPSRNKILRRGKHRGMNAFDDPARS
jgi:hypothetical protein